MAMGLAVEVFAPADIPVDAFSFDEQPNRLTATNTSTPNRNDRDISSSFLK
jgi:hypothetical protein